MEILECDDVEVYVEAVVLMYCEDLKKRLMGEEVSKVLELLKVNSFLSLIHPFENLLSELFSRLHHFLSCFHDLGWIFFSAMCGKVRWSFLIFGLPFSFCNIIFWVIGIGSAGAMRISCL